MCFLEGIRLVRAFGESRDLVFSPSRSNLGLVSSRLAGFVRNREIYNLGMVSGPVLLKIKGKSRILIKNANRNLVLTPSRSDLVVQSSRFFLRNPRREIYNLGMVSGPVLLNIKGTS